MSVGGASGSASEPARAATPAPDPERLGHFRIAARLGQGATGVVYHAVDEVLGRDVAIKLLTPGVGDDDARRIRFEREARAVASLSHPNIVRVHSVEVEGTNVFLVMELLRGVDLASVIRGGGMLPARLLDLAVPLVDAVAAAHERGIVHRDLKPANVFITDEGVVKVLDFGLAKIAGVSTSEGGGAPSLTVDGRILGTPAYMAPEQAEGAPADARADVFSLGVLLYEMAVGERPFTGESVASVLTSTLRDEPPSVDVRNPAMPPRLGRIVQRCLKKDPDARYPSCRDLLRDLEELRAEVAPQSVPRPAPSHRPPPPLPTSARGPTRRGALVAALVTGAALGFALMLRVRHPSAPTSAPRGAPEVPAASGPQGPQFTRVQRMSWTSTFKGTPIISPDGTWTAFSMRVGDKTDVYEQRIGGRNATNLTARSGADDDQPAISPDGEMIAFHSTEGTGGIFVMGATGENRRRMSDVGRTPSWSPDGRLLAVSTADADSPLQRTFRGELYVIDVARETSRRVDTGEDSIQPSFSPDGRFLAYHYWDGLAERGIAVRSLADGKTAHLSRGGAMWTPAWSPDGRYVYATILRAGLSNVWRVPFDPRAVSFGKPEAVTNGLGFAVGFPSLSHDGKKLLLDATHVTHNIARSAFAAGTAQLAGPLQPLTHGNNAFGDLDVSPDGAWIAFGQGENAAYELPQEDVFVARADGTDVRRLTDDAPYDRFPRWSADGTRIFFYSQRGEVVGPGRWSIAPDAISLWSIAPDGRGLSRVFGPVGGRVTNGVANPVDARVAALSGEKCVLLDTARPPDQALVRELPDPAPGQYLYPSAWSADGKTLYGEVVDVAKGVTTGIYAVDPDRGTYQRLGPPADQCAPLRDGRSVLYLWNRKLLVLDVLRGTTRPLLDLAPDGLDSFSLSRDERWLYVSVVSSEGDLWLAEPE